jgi:hypothetical protein
VRAFILALLLASAGIMAVTPALARHHHGSGPEHDGNEHGAGKDHDGRPR